MHDAGVETIAAGIERYLASNPSAADSVVGIAQWWLPTVGLDLVSDDAVEAALCWLAERGVVEAVDLGDRQRFWRKAPGGQADPPGQEQTEKHG